MNANHRWSSLIPRSLLDPVMLHAMATMTRIIERLRPTCVPIRPRSMIAAIAISPRQVATPTRRVMVSVMVESKCLCRQSYEVSRGGRRVLSGSQQIEGLECGQKRQRGCGAPHAEAGFEHTRAVCAPGQRGNFIPPMALVLFHQLSNFSVERGESEGLAYGLWHDRPGTTALPNAGDYRLCGILQASRCEYGVGPEEATLVLDYCRPQGPRTSDADCG